MTTRTAIAANGTWSSTSAWSGGIVPTGTDDALLGSGGNTAYTITLNTAQSAASVSIAGSTSGAKNTTLTLTAGVLTIGGNLSLASTSGMGNAFIRGGGSIQVGGTFTGNGTVISAGVLVINAASIASTGSLLAGGAGGTLDIEVGLLGSASNTVTQIGASTAGTLLVGSGKLEATSLLALSNGTVKVAGASVLKIDAAVAVTSTGTSTGTLLVSGGTLDLALGGSAAGGGVVFLDVAGSKLQVEGALTGSIAFASTAVNGQIVVDASTTGAKNLLSGATITNFKAGDQFIVAGGDTEVVTGGNTIQVYNGGTAGTLIETLTLGAGSTSVANGTFALSGGVITAACYLEGTLLLTESGSVAVEDLQIGDMVATVEGPQPIRWIGKRAYLTRLINQHHRDALLPVRFSAGSLADNVPVRDLFVSPEHMMMLDGVLVAAHNLVNGTTITRHDDLEVVKYFHIELPQHSVMFAEGAASESYLDTGNRNMFSNVLEYAELGLPVGDTEPCLPVVSEGPALVAIRSQLAARAEACGFGATLDADLHLLVDGSAVYPSAVERGTYSFDIARPTSDIRIVSRSVVPADIDPACADRRRLGVALAGLSISGGGLAVDMLAGESRLVDGFHPTEGQSRWTNGNAGLPVAMLGLMAGPFTLELRIIGTDLAYPIAPHADVVTLAAARHDMRRHLKVA